MWLSPMVEIRAGAGSRAFPLARICDNPKIMKKSIKDNPKKTRGRPATGKAPLVGVRMTEEFQAEIKSWAKKQPDSLPLAAAIRRLVELGLTVKSKGRPRRETKQRARELAGAAVDKLTDTTASPEDQASRKRRLIKGPEEFREDRLDMPRAKEK
jgi:hypothetical protein